MMDTIPYPESPLDFEDAAYPCKGCGEILEEGKAFELAGNRWHINCFRCNTCNTLLDSDANLLLLGDGSLICNNCTYSCSSCGNKIEDLAILTGDQAFCANCFKCRNCKRKIENLRYARTTQGIFCMDCHDALMARRRKRTARGGSSAKKNNAILDKSLPSLPPVEDRKTTYIPGTETLWSDVYPTDSPDMSSLPTTTNELRTIAELEGGTPSQPHSHNQSQAQSPVPPDAGNLTLPSTTYRNNRNSYQSAKSDGKEEFLIPVAFDPNPSKGTPPIGSSHGTPRTTEERSQDYFARNNTQPSASAPVAAPTASKNASPHIAFQEKGREISHDPVETDSRKGRSETMAQPPYLPERSRERKPDPLHTSSQVARHESSRSEQFKLQDAPKSRHDGRSGTSTPRAAPTEQNRSPTLENVSLSLDHSYLDPSPSQEDGPAVNGTTDSPRPLPSVASNVLHNIPKRGDSLESANAANKRVIPRKEVNSSANVPSAYNEPPKDVPTSPKLADPPMDSTKANGGKVISSPIASNESHSILEAPNAVHRRVGSGMVAPPFVEPRAAPPPPPADHSRSRNESINATPTDLQRLTEAPRSPRLPRWSGGGDFTLEEDMARILGDEPQAHESFLRRVSNSVRHGRSYSDKSGRMSRDRWPRSPIAASTPGQDISSPTSTSPENRDELVWFKNELRRERQKNVEREKRIVELEAQLDQSANIKQVNSELREKRSTMVILDSKKEIVVRELETLTKHIAEARASKEPFDLGKLSNSVLLDFAESLERLKDSFAPQIEESIEKRNDLLDEISRLNVMKDKSFQEFEQLSSKNAQLAELNNQLVHQIQDIYKANTGLNPDVNRSPAPNGLGIYSHHKDKSQVSIDSRDARTFTTDVSVADSGTTLQGDAEPITVIGGPNVVSIKKIQPKKFDWRRGQKVAKGITKGVKGAFSSTQQSYNRDLQFAETGAYGQIPAGQEVSGAARTNTEPSKQGGFGLFGNQKVPPKGNGLYATPNANASTPSLTPDPATHLFGSDLVQRAHFEETSVPWIVKRCIEEVESRGMDQEGIYRKSGGNSQVQQVKEAFEDPSADRSHEISDPDLDIHAVTSGLKQYFRKLPSPLITYEVYDLLLGTQMDATAPEARRLENVQRALQELPSVHYKTLDFLVRHLSDVVKHEKDNLMTSMNIAVVFAPTIMRPESVSRELTDTKAKNEVVKWMVENYLKIFQET